MSILKEDYIEMKHKGVYFWELFYEYYNDKEGQFIDFQDFSKAFAWAWPQLGQNAQVLIIRMVEYFDAKFHVIKIISKEGQLIKEY